MKYYKIIGLICCIVLIVACFLPWTYHADLDKNFTGFFSEKNAYGKPGKTFIFLTLVSIVLILVPRIWAKRTHIIVAGVTVAYAIKSYILFTSCYNAYCPEKKLGIYLVMFTSFALLAVAILPDMKIISSKTESAGAQTIK